MKTILISDYEPIINEIDLVIEFFEKGLTYFHIRKRNFSYAQLYDYVTSIPQKYHKYCIIDEHLELAHDLGLKGVHFTKLNTIEKYAELNQMSITDVIEKFGHISYTLHTLKDLNELKKLDYKYNYVLLSPVFDSISNIGYNSKLNINAIKSFLGKNESLTNVIAVGGVTDHRIRDVIDNNFAGAAILGHIWEQFKDDFNIAAAIKKYDEIIEMASIWEGVGT